MTQKPGTTPQFPSGCSLRDSDAVQQRAESLVRLTADYVKADNEGGGGTHHRSDALAEKLQELWDQRNTSDVDALALTVQAVSLAAALLLENERLGGRPAVDACLDQWAHRVTRPSNGADAVFTVTVGHGGPSDFPF